MSNTSFCLTVTRVIAEAWFDDLFFFFFFFRFYQARDRVNVTDFMTCGLQFTKKMDRCLLEIVLAWLGKSRLK